MTKILDSAEIEFSKKGFAAARVDEIAKNAGINKQMIYAHYKSKENLYKIILQRVYERNAECEEEISNIEFTGIDTIRFIILEYFNFLIKNPSFVRLILWENLNSAKYIDNIHSAIFGGAEKMLKIGVDTGIFRKDLDIDQTVLSLNMFCFSSFSNIYTVSKLLKKDLSTEAELTKRAEHIADVITKYIV